MDQRGGSGNADPHQCEIKASGAAANRPRTVGPGCESALAWIEGLSAGRARFPCGSFRRKRTELQTDSKPASERPTPLKAAVQAA